MTTTNVADAGTELHRQFRSDQPNYAEMARLLTFIERSGFLVEYDSTQKYIHLSKAVTP